MHMAFVLKYIVIFVNWDEGGGGLVYNLMNKAFINWDERGGGGGWFTIQ